MIRWMPLLAPLLIAGPALAAPRVAVDIAPVHSLVARVMDGVGTADLIVPPGASPHGFALRPSDARTLESAEIVVWVGEALSPWLEGPIGTLAGDATVIELMAVPGTVLLDYRTGATFDAHDHDHGHGHDHSHGHHHDHAADDHGHDHAHDHSHDDAHDHGHAHDDSHDHDHAADDHVHDHAHDHSHDDAHDHGHAHDDGHDHDHAADDHGHDHAHDHGHHHHEGADSHVWLDPVNARLWLGVIAEVLGAADPDNADAYRANASAGQAEIDALIAELEETLAPVAGRGFIVFHDAYQYFEARFGIAAAGSITLSDATTPSAARIAEIRARIAELDAACVFAEPQFEPRIVQTVIEGSDARSGVLDPLGADLDLGPDLYPSLLRGMATALVDCLG